MYIVSWAWPSPGIEPRIPTVSGWSEGLHTSIVAHSCVEVQQRVLGAGAGVAEGAEAAQRRRGASRSSASAASGEDDRACARAMLLKIAPTVCAGAVGLAPRAACATAAV